MHIFLKLITVDMCQVHDTHGNSPGRSTLNEDVPLISSEFQAVTSQSSECVDECRSHTAGDDVLNPPSQSFQRLGLDKAGHVFELVSAHLN